MSSSEKSNGTVFIWKIENFSYMKDITLPSPSFRSISGNWEVRIMPRAFEDRKYIDIGLHRFQNTKEIFNCSMAFLDSDDFPQIWEQKKKVNFTYLGISNSIDFVKLRIKNNELFRSKRTAILPNNTLTVQCLIWQTPEELVLPLKCFARTRIEPRAESVKKSFIWKIENAKSFTIPETRVEAMGGNFDSLTFKLSLNSEDEFRVTLKPSLFRTHVKVKISVLDVTGKNIQFVNAECQFEKKEQEWTFDTNITKTMLMFYENLFLPGNTLSLQFTCALSGNITFHRMVNEDEILVNNPQSIVPLSPIPQPIERIDEPESKPQNKSNHSYSISQALQKMYEEGFLSDYILRIGSTEYPVHKAVLGARSDVFKAMFTTDMKEKDGNCVDIHDVDRDTLQKLLRFVYSDIVEERMGWEYAARLYAAADKYALEPLKLRCSKILDSELCVFSALQILTLADMHQDQHLKSAALHFISDNNKEIVGTESWFKFEEENAKLAIETLRKLYLQKVDGS